MKILVFMAISFMFAYAAHAQTAPLQSEELWKKKVSALNDEYFVKLRELQAEHIQLLEGLKTEATRGDRLDEAITLRDQIEHFKSAMGDPQVPDDSSKLSKEKARLASILKQSKWDCTTNPNLSKWAGTHVIFHENGTIIPANDLSAKLPHHRWAILDGRTIIGMFGDYQMVFRLNNKGNALEVLEVGNVIDVMAIRHSYVVESPPIARVPRDK